MCGICGTVGRASEREIAYMTAVMSHRGPDGDGVHLFDGDVPAALGHRRLAIIDPGPSGAQPMGFRDRWWITYNGELYNFRELKRELEARGERFETSCDTEIVLRLFALYGPRMLERMNGIYAFGIWDSQERRLFLARDKMGVKPLYFVQTRECFAFASELKALLPYLGSPRLDETAFADYLTFLWVPDPKTAFVDVVKLQPGHYAWFSEGRLSVTQYWDLDLQPTERGEDEWRELVRDTVTQAVRRQTVSDVPLGSFLSGGIDSSAVVAAMASGGERVKTYTIGFSEGDLEHEIVPDDLAYARRMGSALRTEYHEEILTPNVLELLPKAVWHLEEPVADPAAISTYLICRAAGALMPVMLSGVGGDELFAGYPRHLAYRLSRAFDALPGTVRSGLEAAARPIARPGRPGRMRGPRRNLWKYMRAAGKSPVDRYLSFLSYYQRDELARLLTPAAQSDLEGYDPFSVHRGYLERGPASDELARLLYVDAKTFLPCLNLTYTDKMGMAASVEVRVPLLDDELVHLAAQIPSSLKLRGWRRKYIFKRSQEGILPRDVIWRRKAGFGAPVRSWLANDLAPVVSELLNDDTLRDRGLIDPAAVRRLWDDNVSGVADNSLRLYALLNFELWCRTFVDRTWSFDTAPGPQVSLA